MTGKNSKNDASSASLSRRAFLERLGVSTAVAAAAIHAPSARADDNSRRESGPPRENLDRSSTARAEERRNQAFQLRVRAANEEHAIPVPDQVNNGDEVLYPNRIGNFSKALPHNNIGEVDPAAYDSLLIAVTSGDPSDFAKIPLGGTVKLANPQGGLAFNLQGTDSGQLTIPPAPAVASAERAGEMVEDYWMALTRDIPFSQYGNEPVTAAAITELNKLSDFTGPKDMVSGHVTPGTLFRGFTPGDMVGPYISQFLLQPVAFGAVSAALGALNVEQKYQTRRAGTDYLTDPTSWLGCQNGQGAFGQNMFSGTSYLKNGRDLASYDHVDFPNQAVLSATLWLLQHNARFNPGNPYLTSITNQGGGITFGNNRIIALLYEVSVLAAKAAFYQKWFVHRTLRPEAYGGLVHNTITGIAHYPLHRDVLNSQAVSRVFSRYGRYLLPHADPEGCPAHPSYPEQHSVNAGASVTVLKWFFDESFVIPNPRVAADDGQSLVPYTGSDAGEITVGGELNKLANNIALGRDFEAVHWRSDAVQGLLLGEAVAISVLRDQQSNFNEPFNGFTFTKFDGSTITV